MGTYFRFGDVDAGATVPEIYRLTAFNSGGVITTPWLDEAIGVTGTTAISLNDMPAWDFDSVTGVYTIDGTAIVGNPNLAFFLPNNTALTSLEVTRTSTFQNFALYAPTAATVPEPSTFVQVAFSLMGLGWFGWRKRTLVNPQI